MLICDRRKKAFTTGDCVLTKFTYKAKKNKGTLAKDYWQNKNPTFSSAI